MGVLRYQLYGSTMQQATRNSVEDALKRWIQDWLPLDMQGEQSACRAFYQGRELAEHRHRIEHAKRGVVQNGDSLMVSESGIWAFLDRNEQEALLKKMLRQDFEAGVLSHPICRNLLISALSSFVELLNDSSGRVTEFSVDQALRHGSGWVLLELEMVGQRIQLLVAPDVVTRWGGKGHPYPRRKAAHLYSPKELCAHIDVTLRAELEPLELSIDELCSLNVGDVVRLSHMLSSPIHLKVSEELPLCLGRLGAQDGRRAIQVVKEK